jgi:biopolymer transport protein TolR
LKKNYKKRKSISEINVTPFVDVMLVLLIIFMVTAPLLTAGIKVNLPESSSILKNEKNDPVTVTINSKGEIFLQKKKFSADGLIKKLKALKSQNKDLKIYIKGDKKLNYGKVMDLMSFINKSGFKKVALVTKLK